MSKWTEQEINDAYLNQAFNQGYQYAKWEESKRNEWQQYEEERTPFLLEIHEREMPLVFIVDGQDLMQD